MTSVSIPWMIALGFSMVISMTCLEAEDSIKSSTAPQGGDSLLRPDPKGLRDFPVEEELRTTGLS